MRTAPVYFPSVPRRPFGRGRRYILATITEARPTISDDAQLFLTTFMVGFIFMSVYLA